MSKHQPEPTQIWYQVWNERVMYEHLKNRLCSESHAYNFNRYEKKYGEKSHLSSTFLKEKSDDDETDGAGPLIA